MVQAFLDIGNRDARNTVTQKPGHVHNGFSMQCDKASRCECASCDKELSRELSKTLKSCGIRKIEEEASGALSANRLRKDLSENFGRLKNVSEAVSSHLLALKLRSWEVVKLKGLKG